MTKVNPENSDIEEFKLYLQQVNKDEPIYKVLNVSHGAFNPVRGVSYGYLGGLEVLKGKNCKVQISEQ